MKSSVLSGLVLVAAQVFGPLPAALANPLGGVVAAGSATISQSGSALTINQNSSHAIINWGSFNISAGESTSFHFLGAAGANSAVLNEVSASAGQSFINGLLNSYVGPGNHVGGTVFIYNPNGILIGSQGSINVGSLIGTTLSLGGSSFMKGGNLSLGAPSVTGGGAIQNNGQISALDGDIFLIAHNVENNGTLTARNVGLAAGSYVEIKQPGQPGADRISVLAGDPSDPGGTGVNNSSTGLIKAVTTELQAAGGNVYALAVNNAGVIHADTLVSQGGHIYLTGNGGTVQNSGTLDASDTAAGGTGGAVTITGSQITLTGTSTINADGESGGGTVLIGGGSKGENPNVPDATDTTVAAGAVITADAISKGHGGQVVVWSDDTTIFNGHISARGGAEGGNGGSAEISGAQSLSVTGHADLSAPNGSDGTLLLDPGSVTIVSGGNTGPSGTMNTFNDGWINNQLDFDSSLIIDTANSTDGLAQNLTVQAGANVAWNSANNLTLNGANSLTVSGTINATGAGGLFLNSASGNIAIFNSVGAGAGGVSMTAANGINIAGGVTVNGPVTLNADSGNTGVGVLTLGAAVSTGGNPLNISAGGITFNAGGSLNSGTAAATINATDGNSIGLGSAVGGGLNISDTDLGDIMAGELILNTTGAGTVNVGGISLANSAGVGAVSINSLGVTFNAPSAFASGLEVATAGSINLNASLNAASVTLNNGGSVTGTGELTATTLTLAGAGTVGTTLFPINTDVGNIVLDAGAGAIGNSSINNAANPVNISGTTGGGSIDLAAGATTINGTLDAGTGNVTLDAAALNLNNNVTGTTVTLDNSGQVSGAGTINATTLELEGAGNVGANGGAINADVAGIALNGNSGSAWLNNGANAANLSGTTGGSVTLAAGPVTFGMTTVGGNLGVTASGTVSQTGTVSVTGTTGVSAGANAITLNNAGNDFGGAVTVNNSGANGVTLNNGNNELLVNGSVGGNLFATGAGISDGGSALTVGGTTSLTAGAANPISFANPGDTFTGAVTVQSGDNVTLVDTAALAVNGTVTGSLTATGAGISDGGSALTVGGTTSLTAGTANPINFGNAGDTFTGAVTVQSGDNVTLVDSAALVVNGTVTGNLTATGAGIGDGGSALTVWGTTSLTAGTAHPISFGNVGDNFAGAVTVQSGENVTLVDTAALAVNGTVTGNLTATGAGISDGGGVLTVGGTTLLTAGAANPITFGNAGDTFTGAVTVQSGDNVTLMDTAALAVNGTVMGNLTATGAGIGDGGSALTVGGTTSLTAGAANPITFGNAGDSFAGAVTIQSGDNVTLVDTAALAVNGTVTGNLTATGAGISDGGSALTVGGTTSLTAGTANPITFGNAGDSFAGAVTIQSGDNVTLVDTAALAVNGTVTGNLIATGAGISDGGSALTVGGTTSLTAGTANPITFGNAGDSFAGAVTIQSGDNVTLVDTAALAVNGTVTGNLTATGTGISDGGSALTVGGTTSLTAGMANPITFGNAGDSFAGAVTIQSGDNVTLVDTAALAVDGTVTGNLTATGAGISDGGSALNVGGTTSLTAGTGNNIAFTAAGDSFAGAVSIINGKNVTLDDVLSLTLNGTVSGNLSASANGIDINAALTVNGAQGVTLNADPNNTGTDDLTIGAALNTTAANGPVTITAANMDLAGGSINSGQGVVSITASDGGTIGLGAAAGDLSLTGAELANITTSGGLTFTTTGGANVSIDGVTAANSQNVTGPLTINAPGGTAGFFTTPSYFNSLVVNAGAIDLNADVTTAAVAGQAYNGPVTLSAPMVLTANNGGGISFSSTIDGAQSLDVETTGAATFDGAIGTGTTLASLTVDATDTAGLIDLNGGAVTTTGAQTYGGATTLGANTILTTTTGAGTVSLAGVTLGSDNLTLANGGAATLNGALSGTGILQASGGGSLTVDNTIVAGFVSDSEATTFNGLGGIESVTTVAGQSYSGSVTLDANTTLNGTALSLAAVNLNNDDLTLNNSGAATLNGAVTGTGVLTATGAGNLTVGSAISAGSVVDNEATTLGGGAITTTGSQDYTGNLTLGADTTFNTGTTLALGAPGNPGTPVTLTGNGHNLTLNNTGASTLNASISGVGALTATGGGLNLENDITAVSVLDNEVTTLSGTGIPAVETIVTTGGQIYNAPVTLAAAAMLSSTGGGNITLGSTVIGAGRLEVETAGTTTFDAPVNAQSLIVDQTDTGGSIDLNGGTVTTSAGQIYDGAVKLSSDTLLSDTGGGAISFGPLASVTGAQLLEVETYGTTTFDAAVNVRRLTMDQADSGGTIDLNGGTVTTSLGQIYDAAVKLGAGTLLSDTGGSAISFGPSATIIGAQSLEVETAGTTTFGAAVGVKSLTVDLTDTSGAIDLNGSLVTTTGSQSYDTVNTINLGANTTLTTGTTLALGNVNGDGYSLTLNNGAAATVNGAISDVSAFTASTTGPLAKGNLTLNGNITTTAAGSITILEDTTFTRPIALAFDTLTLGQKSPSLEAEFYGPGPIIFDNTGEVDLVYGSLEDITSFRFENPQLAFLPGQPEISVEIPITELLEAEGTSIRSAFDLAKKTVTNTEPIEMEVDMRSPSVAGSHLLRSGQLYRSENISP